MNLTALIVTAHRPRLPARRPPVQSDNISCPHVRRPACLRHPYHQVPHLHRHPRHTYRLLLHIHRLTTVNTAVDFVTHLLKHLNKQVRHLMKRTELWEGSEVNKRNSCEIACAEIVSSLVLLTFLFGKNA